MLSICICFAGYAGTRCPVTRVSGLSPNHVARVWTAAGKPLGSYLIYVSIALRGLYVISYIYLSTVNSHLVDPLSTIWEFLFARPTPLFLN